MNFKGVAIWVYYRPVFNKSESTVQEQISIYCEEEAHPLPSVPAPEYPLIP